MKFLNYSVAFVIPVSAPISDFWERIYKYCAVFLTYWIVYGFLHYYNNYSYIIISLVAQIAKLHFRLIIQIADLNSEWQDKSASCQSAGE